MRLFPFRFGQFESLREEEDFLLISWDSCRYDAYVKANTPMLDRFARARRGWAMGTYTLPAHIAMFQGFLPHVFGDEPLYNRFCQQLWRIGHRRVHVKPLVTFPRRTRNIAAGFRSRGYFTAGVAAMDWFRDAEILRDGFKKFFVTGSVARRQNQWLMEMLDKNARRRNFFAFVNYGETHSPFHHEEMNGGAAEVKELFSRSRLWNQRGLLDPCWTFHEEAFNLQVKCAEFLDARTGELIDFLIRRGKPATVVVCGDHGECFGEAGLYGHAFYHEKIMEVPILIFRVNGPPHPPPEASVHAPHHHEALASAHST
jgi:membrane-anchored protein YejM (alkaline phosphatase superfamily)